LHNKKSNHNFILMKKMNLTFSLILSFLFLGYFSYAQVDTTAKTIDGKTTEQIIREYQWWSAERNDWPNLGRYRDANAKLPPVAPGENRVVFMGNSITEGWIYTCPEFFEGKPYIDRGISGQTTPQMLIRFRQDVIGLKPSVVVLLCGINDIAQNTGPSTLEMIEGNIASMTEIAEANGIKVVLCSVLPAYDFPWRPGLEPAEKVVALNKWIKAYATEKGFIYLDYFSSMADEKNAMKAEYSEDGVHPNKAGYAIMEKILDKVLGTIFE
jgi:lysophospholipase L1-like esterase